MKSARFNDLGIDEAIGDGNCAWNAFILGLIRILDQLETDQLDAFVNSAAPVLKVERNWPAVKAKMQSLHKSDKQPLQRLLAPVMRRLGIALAEADVAHIERTRHPLFSSFHEYVREQLGRRVAGVKDDVYIRHDFIVNQFKQIFTLLNAAYSKEQLESFNAKQLDEVIDRFNDQLWQWWTVSALAGQPSGYNSFLRAMKRDGQWAGDLELAQLARYFKINLDVVRGNFTHHIHLNYGTLPLVGLTEAEVVQLRDRRIVNHRENGETELRLLPVSGLPEVKQRLEQVPEFAKVNNLVQARRGGLKSSIVPADWSRECVTELKKRDVVKTTDGVTKFIVDDDVAASRIAAMYRAEQIEAAWNVHYKKAVPTMTLSNEIGVHWNNTRVVVTPDEEKIIQRSKSDAFLLENWRSMKDQTRKNAVLGKFGNTISQQESKWKALIEKARQEEGAAAGKENTLFYRVSDSEKIQVSIETQIELDAELAKKVQLEEYELSLRPVPVKPRL